jgi:hypothetical protein
MEQPKSKALVVKCSRCKKFADPVWAMGKEWRVITFITPIMRRVKTKMYCEDCKDKVA